MTHDTFTIQFLGTTHSFPINGTFWLFLRTEQLLPRDSEGKPVPFSFTDPEHLCLMMWVIIRDNNPMSPCTSYEQFLDYLSIDLFRTLRERIIHRFSVLEPSIPSSGTSTQQSTEQAIGQADAPTTEETTTTESTTATSSPNS